MTFDQGIKIAEIAGPIVLGLMGAGVINKNTPHWSKWSGLFGKIVGLLVEIADRLKINWRDPDANPQVNATITVEPAVNPVKE